MSAIKLQKERYYKLDDCFRNNLQNWTLPLLLNAINQWLQNEGLKGISKRTLQDDIKYLKEVENAPIKAYKDGKQNYFKYSDSNFSIRDKPLNKSDEKNIRKAVNILRQLKGLGIADELAETVQRLEQKIELGNELTNNNLQFEHNIYYAGKEWFADIYDFLQHSKSMKLTYRPFETKESVVLNIHPYLLKQYNQRWFLIGWCVEYDSLGTYALDRIINAKVSSIEFVKHPSFNPEMYDKHLLGITIPHGKSPEKLVLIFNPKRAKYFITKPFGNIEFEQTLENGNVEITLTMFINLELEAAILQFGKDVIVQEPKHLRNKIAEILNEACKNYTKN